MRSLCAYVCTEVWNFTSWHTGKCFPYKKIFFYNYTLLVALLWECQDETRTIVSWSLDLTPVMFAYRVFCCRRLILSRLKMLAVWKLYRCKAMLQNLPSPMDSCETSSGEFDWLIIPSLITGGSYPQDRKHP